MEKDVLLTDAEIKHSISFAPSDTPEYARWNDKTLPLFKVVAKAQIAKVLRLQSQSVELRERIAEQYWKEYRIGCNASFWNLSWNHIKSTVLSKGKDVSDSLHVKTCYDFADQIISLITPAIKADAFNKWAEAQIKAEQLIKAEAREQAFKEVGEWLFSKYKAGWANHGVDADGKPECFDLCFYGTEIEALKSGKLPKE